MKARLISRKQGEFSIGETATIGRSKESEVRLEASMVSNEHARLSFDGERSAYVLEDLGSLNGTFLDGVRVDRPEVLGTLHVLRFGDLEDFVFQVLSDAASTAGETIDIPATGKTQVGGEIPVLPSSLRDSDANDRDSGGTRVEKDVVPLPEVLARAGEAVRERAAGARRLALEVSLGGHAKLFALDAGKNVVGRSKAADVRLDLPDLSRRHATLTVSGETVRIRDEGSRNRTFVDGQPIDTEVVLEIGARIVFGRLEAKLVRTQPEPETEAGTETNS